MIWLTRNICTKASIVTTSLILGVTLIFTYIYPVFRLPEGVDEVKRTADVTEAARLREGNVVDLKSALIYGLGSAIALAIGICGYLVKYKNRELRCLPAIIIGVITVAICFNSYYCGMKYLDVLADFNAKFRSPDLDARQLTYWADWQVWNILLGVVNYGIFLCIFTRKKMVIRRDTGIYHLPE